MAKFKLSRKALDDLDRIWDYTIETWSKEQAIKYYELLKEAVKNIASAERPIGKPYELIKKGLYGYHTGRHIVFYRKGADDTTYIIRILHERMDFKRHI